MADDPDERLIEQTKSRIRALRGSAEDRVRGVEMREALQRLRRAPKKTAKKAAARTHLQELLKDEDLIDQAKAIMVAVLKSDPSECRSDSPEGRGVLILQTTKELLLAKERRDPDRVVFARHHLQALIKDHNSRRGGRPEKQDRDEALAREFQTRRRRTPSYVSDIALMEKIGSEQVHRQELKRSQAIKVIKRGLKKLSAKTD